MKRTLLLTALSATLLCSNTSEAQSLPVVSSLPKVTVGIKAGANFQELTGDTWSQAYKASYLAGAFVGLQKHKWGVQLEAMIKGANYDVSVGGSELKTVSLDIPVLLEYRLIPRLWLQVGPQFSSIISAKDNSGDDVKKSFKSGDFQGVLGLEARLPLHFTAGARYILGFTDINNGSAGAGTEAWKERSIQLYIGFRFL